MHVLYIVLIIWGAVAALYSFRLCQKYFAFFEGQLRNGTIITQAIGTGLIWPVTLLWNGFHGVWSELAPVKIAAAPTPPAQFDPTKPLPGVGEIVAEAARDNLTAQGNRNPW